MEKLGRAKSNVPFTGIGTVCSRQTDVMAAVVAQSSQHLQPWGGREAFAAAVWGEAWAMHRLG